MFNPFDIKTHSSDFFDSENQTKVTCTSFSSNNQIIKSSSNYKMRVYYFTHASSEGANESSIPTCSPVHSSSTLTKKVYFDALGTSQNQSCLIDFLPCPVKPALIRGYRILLKDTQSRSKGDGYIFMRE